MHPIRTLVRPLTMAAACALLALACSSAEDDPVETALPDTDSNSASAPASASASSTSPEPAEESPEESASAGGPEPVEESADVEAVPETSAFPLTVVDAAGNEFTFDEPPGISCTWFGCVEAAAALGIDLKASMASPEEHATAFLGSEVEHFIDDSLNPEEWAAAEVELIFNRADAQSIPQFDAVRDAIDTFYLHSTAPGQAPTEGSLGGEEAYLENLRLLAAIAGDPAAADRAIADYEAMVETLTRLSTPETADQTIGILLGIDGYGALGPDGAFCELLSKTGHGTCVGEGFGALLNAEAFLALDPDLILAARWAGTTTVADRAANDPVWNLLSAVQNDRVYETDGWRFFCCSTSAQILMAQEYVGLVLPEAGIPRPPVEENDFDPSASPLVIG